MGVSKKIPPSHTKILSQTKILFNLMLRTPLYPLDLFELTLFGETMRLTVEKANELLDKARSEPLNTAWNRHSICVGYMHDIGKYKNPTNTDWHDVLGYQKRR